MTSTPPPETRSCIPTPTDSQQCAARPGYPAAASDLIRTVAIIADWLERSGQINPADLVARNLDLAKELRAAVQEFSTK